jgi:hypothetical protein
MQSQEEILRLFDEYGRGFAPSDFLFTEHNASAMFNYVSEKYGGLFSVSYLIEAEKALGVQLQRKPQPKEPTQAEIAAKGEARMHRDWLESLKPQTTLYQQKLGQNRLDENKKAADAKELKSINSKIENEVGNFSVGHASGHQDYSRTDSGKQTLREVRDKHDRQTIEGARRALSAVRLAKSKLS